MIESAGGMIPFICHVFLILFGGFFGLSFAFNKNFVQNSLGFASKDAIFESKIKNEMRIIAVKLTI